MPAGKVKPRMPSPYNEGAHARALCLRKCDNPYARKSSAASWWLAGWNDKDIEEQHR